MLCILVEKPVEATVITFSSTLLILISTNLNLDLANHHWSFSFLPSSPVLAFESTGLTLHFDILFAHPNPVDFSHQKIGKLSLSKGIFLHIVKAERDI